MLKFQSIKKCLTDISYIPSIIINLIISSIIILITIIFKFFSENKTFSLKNFMFIAGIYILQMTVVFVLGRVLVNIFNDGNYSRTVYLCSQSFIYMPFIILINNILLLSGLPSILTIIFFSMHSMINCYFFDVNNGFGYYKEEDQRSMLIHYLILILSNLCIFWFHIVLMRNIWRVWN